MNTKFKRALSSILTFVMVMSCMMVMNLSSVYAANYGGTNDNILTGDPNSETLNDYSNSRVTITKDTDNNSVTYEYNFANLDANVDFFGLAVNKIADTGKFNADDAYIQFTTDGKFDVTLTSTSKASNTQLTFGPGKDISKEVFTSTVAENIATGKKENLDAGTYTFGRSGSDAYIEKLTIKVTKTDYAEGVVTFDASKVKVSKINGDSVTTGTTVPGGTMLVIECAESGNNKYLESVNINGSKADITNDKVYFTVNNAQNIEAVIGTSGEQEPITQPIILSGHNLNTGNKDILEGGTRAEEGTVYHFALDDYDNVTYSGTYLQVASKQGINFSTGDLSKTPLNLEVIYGHTKGDRGPILLSSSTEGSKESTQTYGEKTIANVKASTGKIKLESNTNYKISSNSSNLFIYDIIITKDGDNTGVGYTATAGEENTKYVVFKVNSSDMTSSSFDIVKTDGNDDTLISKENTVYKSIEFDSDETKTNADFEADYVVAYKVLEAAANINDEALGAKYKIVFNK